MKIKLAILDNDQSYLNRIVSVFTTKYADKFEVYSFSDVNVAVSSLDNAKIDVFVSSDYFDIDISSLPKRCGFAYSVDSADIETVKEQRAICKFQKADLIYKQILGIFSEKAENVSGIKLGEDTCKVFMFSSVCGGVGNSSMSASCAVHYANKGKKTLYINFEKYGSSDSFFTAEGQFNMSDIVFALKSKKSNIALKLESSVKQDKSGVFFYSEPKIALDMMELNEDDIIRLISELKLSGSYDYIVVDMDSGFERKYAKLMRMVNAIVWVGDGSEISNAKICRAYQSVSILEQNEDSPLYRKISLIYNKFSNKSSKALTGIDIKNIGGAPRYEHASTLDVINQLSAMDMFDKID